MKMEEKLLIAYGTKYGSTAEIAEQIAERLNSTGHPAEVKAVGEVADLSGYRGVILGAPIYMGNWRGLVIDFLRRHREALANLPVAYFAVGMMPKANPEQGRKDLVAVLSRACKAAPGVEPVDTALFTGVLDKSKMNFLHRIIMNVMHAEEGDFRNPAEIESWADRVADKAFASDRRAAAAP